MRAAAFAIVTISALALLPQPGSASPVRDQARLPQSDANPDPNRWQGRHHYLYDEERAEPETTGSDNSNRRACTNEPVRIQNPNGTTGVQRLDRCD